MSNDLLFDAARGIVIFVDADTPVASASSSATDESDAVDPSNESAIGEGVDVAVDDDQEVDAQSDDDAASDAHADGPAPLPSRPKQTVGFGRYLRRRPALRAAAAHARK